MGSHFDCGSMNSIERLYFDDNFWFLYAEH